MHDRMTMREATLLDAAAHFELHKQSVRSLCKAAYSAAQLDAWFDGRTSAIYAKTIDARRLWIGECDGQMTGFVGYTPGEITFLFVTASSNGRGIGTRLFALGMEMAARDFTGPLTVIATLSAQRFYERFGFAVVGHETIVRGSKAVTIDLIRMQRPSTRS